jgi:membrane protein
MAQSGDDKRDEEGPALETGPNPEVEQAAPDRVTELGKRSWWAVLRRTAREFVDDDLTDRAAALTYYSILSIFPAMLVLVAILGAAGESATNEVLKNIQQFAPGAARNILTSAVKELQHSSTTGGVLAIVALLGALWSASGYVSGFIRASNAVYDIPEGRPAWKVTPLRIGLTLALMALAAASALIVVFTGPVARRAGELIGLSDTAVTVWSIVKWPVLVLFVVLMIALLYWAAPNVRGRGFRWVSPGSFLALAIWLLASGGFALYVANLGSYNKTYGTLAGIIIFMVWLWLTNLAILLGLEFEAELSRERAMAGGHPPEEEPYVQPRDTRKWPQRSGDEEPGKP